MITEDQAENHENAAILDPTFDSAITTPSPFGYLMYYGVLADGDIGNLSQGVYMDEDGDPATEGDLFAWWDGNEYRWGADPTYDGNIDEDAFTVVPRELLVEWSMFPLQEAPDANGDFPAGPLYEIGVMDDLAGLNVDTFVYLGRNFTGNQFTVRLTATSVDAAGINPGDIGNQVPAWDPVVGTPAPELATFINNDGVIIIRAGIAGEPLIINLADIVTGELPTAVVENLDTGETENVTLLQDADNPKVFSVSLPTAANGGAGTNNDGTMNVWPEQTVRVSYTDVITEAAPDGSDPQLRTDEVVIPFETLEPVIPSGDDDGGCSCSTNPDGSVDPILPAAVLFALGFLGLRRWEAKHKQER
jgi:MYXO-CTERM domain-containing protein